MMEPPLTADAASLIACCLNARQSLQIFIDRLGLPNKQHMRGKKGRPTFEGPGSQICGALFRSTCDAVMMLEQRFRVKNDVRHASVKEHLALATEVTTPMLLKYGAGIWGSSEPRVTRDDPVHYPRHLRHDDKDDRER
jgi:hypothetical protein